jgi:UDP-3-O-[3-hydroxymyristoyl] glucosamine N-acyltransferase
MIIGNTKPIRIIGYPQSSMTQEFFAEIQKTHKVEIIQPSVFLKSTTQDQYQYIVSVSWDLEERNQIIFDIDQKNLNLISVIHDTVIIGELPGAIVKPGSFIFPYSTVAIGSQVGRHSIIGYYSLVGHYSNLGNNCILRPGSMVNGKSNIGNNCVMNTRSTVTAGSNLVDNITLMAFCSVSKDLTSSGQYAGSPARKIR